MTFFGKSSFHIANFSCQDLLMKYTRCPNNNIIQKCSQSHQDRLYVVRIFMNQMLNQGIFFMFFDRLYGNWGQIWRKEAVPVAVYNKRWNILSVHWQSWQFNLWQTLVLHKNYPKKWEKCSCTRPRVLRWRLPMFAY